jgi:hypothetical protein
MENNNNLEAGLELPDILEPIMVIATDSPIAKPELEVPPGYVLLVALNEDGTDKEGSEFFYPEKSYKRYYSDETKYRLKKKLQ